MLFGSDDCLFHIKAIKDYKAECEGQLSFRKNDVLSVFFVTESDGFWLAGNDHFRGLVPSSYFVKLDDFATESSEETSELADDHCAESSHTSLVTSLNDLSSILSQAPAVIDFREALTSAGANADEIISGAKKIVQSCSERGVLDELGLTEEEALCLAGYAVKVKNGWSMGGAINSVLTQRESEEEVIKTRSLLVLFLRSIRNSNICCLSICGRCLRMLSSCALAPMVMTIRRAAKITFFIINNLVFLFDSDCKDNIFLASQFTVCRGFIVFYYKLITFLPLTI